MIPDPNCPSPQRILLTGGRAPATLELARAFHRAGHTVFVGESLPLHLCRFSTAVAGHVPLPPPRTATAAFVAALEAAIAYHEIALVIPTCEETFYVAHAHERLSAHATIFCEPLDRLAPLHHKGHFAERARAYGVAVPDTRTVESRDALAESLADWPNVVLKPAFSRFAARTLVCPSRREALRDVAPTPADPWVVQRFVSGPQLCSYSIVHHGRITAHTAYRTVWQAGRGATIHFRAIAHEAVTDWVSHFVAEEQFTGQIAFDFIERGPDDVVAIECNPRATSGIHLLAHHPDFPRAFLDPDHAPLIAPPSPPATVAAAMWLYALPTARGHFGAWWRDLREARDVLWRRDDPWPTLTQPLTLLSIAARAARGRCSMLAASTVDIEWNGAPL